MLRERNKIYGTIKFVDISSDEYSPEDNQGLDYKTVCYSNNVNSCYRGVASARCIFAVKMMGYRFLSRK